MGNGGEPTAAPSRRIEAVVMGASAGAIEALSEVLPMLPVSYAVPVMIVVHLPADRKNGLAELFQAKCRVTVKEAEDKEPVENGTIYFAPPNYHLQVESGGHLSLSSDEPVRYSRPSIDVLFESAADAYGERLAGVILTGANNDGAEGLRAICEAGGVAIAQDPRTAQVPTMPVAALATCSKAQSLTLKEIAAFLEQLNLMAVK